MIDFISKETRLLGEDMVGNHQNWKQGPHTYTNGKIHIWTANAPIFNIDTYPNTSAFNIFERIHLKRCIKKSVIKNALHEEEKT